MPLSGLKPSLQGCPVLPTCNVRSPCLAVPLNTMTACRQHNAHRLAFLVAVRSATPQKGFPDEQAFQQREKPYLAVLP